MSFQLVVPVLGDLTQESLATPQPCRTGRQPLLLSVEDDSDLLASRAGVLRIAGCRVRSASSREASSLIGVGAYRIVVCGHSLSDGASAQLATGVRAVSPGTTLLLLKAIQPRSPFVERLFDATLDCAEGPAALVQTVEYLLKAPRRTA